jgi:hypothetical protein
MAKRSVPSPVEPAPAAEPKKAIRKIVQGPERIQIEFLIEDLAKQLIIDRGGLVANGCNGCNSCS